METEDLNRLIRSLNSVGEAAGDGGALVEHVREDEGPLAPFAATAGPVEGEVAPRLAALLAETVRRGGTDLLLVPGSPPVLRLHGALEPVASGAEPFGATEAFDLLSPSLSAERRRRYAAEGAVDLSLRAGDLGRFRVNLHRTRRGAAAAVRVLPKRIPPLAELGLPESLYDLTKGTRGLVLVTGATGSGKTTTLAALVDRINRTSRRHVVTIEDPVEYEHAHGTSVVEQVEVGADAPSFAAALVAALRQDPDVILVGEMRDTETMALAISASETGHLVFGTLSTTTAPATVDRIVNSFPAGQQGQIRTMVSESLKAVISQTLLPRRGGVGRIAAFEILRGTPAVGALIRESKTFQLPGILQTGQLAGMNTMDQALLKLAEERKIDAEVAMDRALKKEPFEKLAAEERLEDA